MILGGDDDDEIRHEHGENAEDEEQDKDDGDDADGFIYVAGAKKDGDRLLSAGGRVLGVTAVADSLEQAIDKAYARVKRVKFENGFYRSDIGARALKALKK